MTIVSTAEPSWQAGPPDWWRRYHGLAPLDKTPDAPPNDDCFVACSTLRRTDKAVQIRCAKGDVWLPVSKTRAVDGGVIVPFWLAEKNGLSG